jgi:hypothetical protein
MQKVEFLEPSVSFPFPSLFGQHKRIGDKGVMGVVVGCNVVTVQ